MRRVETIGSLLKHDRIEEGNLKSFRDRVSPNPSSRNNIFHDEDDVKKEQSDYYTTVQEHKKGQASARLNLVNEAAGMDSKTKNVELSRYHENSNNRQSYGGRVGGMSQVIRQSPPVFDNKPELETRN